MYACKSVLNYDVIFAAGSSDRRSCRLCSTGGETEQWSVNSFSCNRFVVSSLHHSVCLNTVSVCQLNELDSCGSVGLSVVVVNALAFGPRDVRV